MLDPSATRAHGQSPPPSPAGGLRLLVAVTDSMALLLLRGQLRAAREAGFEVVVVSSPGEVATRIAEAEGVRHIAVPMNRAIAPLEDVQSLWRLVAELRAFRPHIVNASTPKAGLLGIVAAWLTGVPCRVHTLRGLRLDTTRGARRGVLAAMTWLTCALSHRVLCISPSLRQRAVDLGLVAADKAVVLGAGSSNGIDLGRFTATDRDRAAAAALRQRLGIARGAPVMGFVGRVARDKGMVELFAAWRALRGAHPDMHWLIVGPPDATDAIPAEVTAELERDPRVHLLGPVSDVVPAYLAMDVLVLPTHREGFGNVLIEAAALEIATVAAAVTGCVDAVADRVTGVLVPPHDVGELVRAIEGYMRDPAMRRAHGQAGRARVQELFDRERLWARMHEEYLDLARAAGLEAGTGRAATLPSSRG